MDFSSKLQFVIDIKPMKPPINVVMDMEKLVPLKGLSIQENKSDDMSQLGITKAVQM